MITKTTIKSKELKFSVVFLALFFVTYVNAQALKKIMSSSPENNIVIEAEDFESQTKTKRRKWYIVSKDEKPKVKKDSDKPHLIGASKEKYIELLPDTDYDIKGNKVEGKTYSRTPGVMAILTYNVDFKIPGRYYVWVKGYSTSSSDNSIHVGLNNNWPDSGKKMYICEALRNQWAWSSHRYTNNENCGLRDRIFIDVKKPGINQVMFSMREDGFEFDKFALTPDAKLRPIK